MYNIYIILFIISKIFFSNFIKCNHRKIELSLSYINLKIKGSGDIKIYSDEYKGDIPDVITINNIINLTNTEIRNTYNFANSGNNINNITLIWNNPLNSTFRMFSSCTKIIEIDFSNFDASSVTDMYFMFYYCLLLTSLDFSNFDTSNVINMDGMFEFCGKLYSLNLSNFNTSSVIKMGGMFEYCKSLHFLDLSNFATSMATDMTRMFYECIELHYLYLSNFDTSKAEITNIFNSCSKLEYITLKFPELNKGLINIIGNWKYLAICGINDEWNNEFILKKYYLNCKSEETEIKKHKCFKISEYPCQICGDNYINKKEIIDNITNVNCYKYKEGYYLDDIELNYKPCYFSCKECYIGGNESKHNCIKCKEEYQYEFNISYYKNCFMNITIDLETDSETDAIIEKENEIHNRTAQVQEMINNFLRQFNIYNIYNERDKINIRKDILITITPTKNIKTNEKENMIIIDLCECENILKYEYNISKNDSLYILQIIYEEEGMKIPKVEYEVYYPFYNNNLKKLNLIL